MTTSARPLTRSAGPSTGLPLRVLLAESPGATRDSLSGMLAEEGCVVLATTDGAKALELYELEGPDCVLLDIDLPGVDGVEVCRRIKAEEKESFVPVIFLAGPSEAGDLMRCMDGGGDDVLPEPLARDLLRAKLRAFERLRQLGATVIGQKRELERNRRHSQQEQAVAERLIAGIVRPAGLEAPNIKHFVSPAEFFNGDLLLADWNPDGSQRLLVGDFTGHGLPAATGAIPVAEAFYTMTQRGFTLGDLAGEIDLKLKRLLPPGMFMAACLIDLDAVACKLTVWNGGFPDILVYSPGEGIVAQIPSEHLPLGVVGAEFDGKVEVADVEDGDRVIAYSDGVDEATNPDGEMFGLGRMMRVLGGCPDSDRLFGTVREALAAFCGTQDQRDDATLVELRCDAALQRRHAREVARRGPVREPLSWRFAFELEADALRHLDPLPIVMRVVTEVQGLAGHRDALHTILSELFSNALDHGLLGLDSRIKSDPHGFTEYYQLRAQALEKLTTGRIKVDLAHQSSREGGRLTIRVEDSGPGFDLQDGEDGVHLSLCGRGLPLVESLCRKLTVHPPGNQVEVLYEWDL